MDADEFDDAFGDDLDLLAALEDSAFLSGMVSTAENTRPVENAVKPATAFVAATTAPPPSKPMTAMERLKQFRFAAGHADSSDSSMTRNEEQANSTAANAAPLTLGPLPRRTTTTTITQPNAASIARPSALLNKLRSVSAAFSQTHGPSQPEHMFQSLQRASTPPINSQPPENAMLGLAAIGLSTQGSATELDRPDTAASQFTIRPVEDAEFGNLQATGTSSVIDLTRAPVAHVPSINGRNERLADISAPTNRQPLGRLGPQIPGPVGQLPALTSDQKVPYSTCFFYFRVCCFGERKR
jgi:hypothetical protein